MFCARSNAGSSSDRSYASLADLSATKYVTVAAPPTMNTRQLMRNTSSCRRMLGPAGESGIVAFPQVAEAAHGADVDTSGFDLRAQPRHVHLDGIRRELLVVTEQAFPDLFLREYAAGPGQEQFEQRPFARCEIHDAIVDPDPLGGHVDRQITHRPLGRCG